MRIARSRAHSFASRLMLRFASDAARSSMPTASTAQTRPSRLPRCWCFFVVRSRRASGAPASSWPWTAHCTHRSAATLRRPMASDPIVYCLTRDRELAAIDERLSGAIAFFYNDAARLHQAVVLREPHVVLVDTGAVRAEYGDAGLGPVFDFLRPPSARLTVRPTAGVEHLVPPRPAPTSRSCRRRRRLRRARCLAPAPGVTSPSCSRSTPATASATSDHRPHERPTPDDRDLVRDRRRADLHARRRPAPGALGAQPDRRPAVRVGRRGRTVDGVARVIEGEGS